MNNNWHGIMKVLKIQHYDSNGRLLWQQCNIRNMLHTDGQEFLLRAAFTGGRISNVIPEFYYLGLDARSTVLVGDTMDNVYFEPTSQYGYQRQKVSSAGDFVLDSEDGHIVATSPIVAFRASNGSWGPVVNLFLTDREDNTGSLISSAKFDSPVTVNNGDSITMRIGLMLQDSTTS